LDGLFTLLFWSMTSLTSLLLSVVLAGLVTSAAHGQASMPYDSTQVSYMLPAGISHKAVQQAVRTYGKVGQGLPLDHTDTLFLNQWMPGLLAKKTTQPNHLSPNKKGNTAKKSRP
jgi:hypothetical protein